MKETYLQVTLDITQKRDVAYSRNYEQKEGASKDDDREESRDGESGRDQIVSLEVFLEVVPRRPVVFSRQIDSK